MSDKFNVGDRVFHIEKGFQGTVAYVGETQFSAGQWVGVILEEPLGKNNGTVKDVQYFTCKENHGTFVRPGQVQLIGSSPDSEMTKSSDSSKLPAATGLKQPSKIQKPGLREPTPSKMKPPTKVPGGGVPGSASKISPSPSMEKLKSGSGSSRISPSPSTEKLKSSPSSEKLKKTGSSDKIKSPTSPENNRPKRRRISRQQSLKELSDDEVEDSDYELTPSIKLTPSENDSPAKKGSAKKKKTQPGKKTPAEKAPATKKERVVRKKGGSAKRSEKLSETDKPLAVAKGSDTVPTRKPYDPTGAYTTKMPAKNSDSQYKDMSKNKKRKLKAVAKRLKKGQKKLQKRWVYCPPQPKTECPFCKKEFATYHTWASHFRGGRCKALRDNEGTDKAAKQSLNTPGSPKLSAVQGNYVRGESRSPSVLEGTSANGAINDPPTPNRARTFPNKPASNNIDWEIDDQLAPPKSKKKLLDQGGSQPPPERRPTFENKIHWRKESQKRPEELPKKRWVYCPPQPKTKCPFCKKDYANYRSWAGHFRGGKCKAIMHDEGLDKAPKQSLETPGPPNVPAVQGNDVRGESQSPTAREGTSKIGDINESSIPTLVRNFPDKPASNNIDWEIDDQLAPPKSKQKLPGPEGSQTLPGGRPSFKNKNHWRNESQKLPQELRKNFCPAPVPMQGISKSTQIHPIQRSSESIAPQVFASERSKASPPGGLSQRTPSQESMKGRGSKGPAAPSPLAKESTPSPKAPQGEAVAKKVSQIINQETARRESGEGIVVGGGAMPEAVELEYLRGETRDLQEKLETLRAKRQEDKQKLMDYERCKIQLQQLLEYKGKMSEVHGELQRQLLDAKREAKEAIESRENNAEDTTELMERIEMTTLDKEMAEEKAEILKTEVEVLKDRVQELEMDLEILKSEIDGHGGSGENVDLGIKLKQLEKDNERLREALVKMRDLSSQTNADNQRLSKENEEMKIQVSECNKKVEKFSEDGNLKDQQLIELQEQVDAALGSEEMVEQLADKNLALEEKVRQLQDAVDDLEQMTQMDQELEENFREKERELRQELDMSNGHINELNLEMSRRDARARDYEDTIKKFRNKTADLQEVIEDLKDQIRTLEEASKEKREEAEDGAEPSGLGRPTSLTGLALTKTMAETVENDVRRLELESNSQHVKYLKSFLPDNFGKAGGDNDAVLLCLLFPRLDAKTEVLAKILYDKYPWVPGGMRREHVIKSHKGEQWGFAFQFIYYINNISTILNLFSSAVNTCSVERLARLAQLQPEMSSQERQLDQYFELLKTNRLDENTSLDGLKKVINYFQNIFTVHLSNEKMDGIKLITNTVRQLQTGVKWIRTELQRLKYYLLPGHEGSSFGKFLDDLEVFIGSIEQECTRLKSGLPAADSGKSITVSKEVADGLVEAATSLERAGSILHAACGMASTQVSMLPDVEGLDPVRLKDLLQEGAEKVNGKVPDKTAMEQVNLLIGLALSETSKVAEVVEKREMETPRQEAQNFPPVLERAHLRKQAAVEAEGLRWQIERKEAEAMELKKNLRAKADELSEMRIRLEMAEKRLTTSGKEGDEKVVRLERKVEELQQDLKKNEKEAEQALEALQQDIEAFEKENAELKERNKQMSKKALLSGMSREAGFSLSTPTSATAPWSPAGGPATESPILLQQIEKLKGALRLSQEACWKAEGAEMERAVKALRPLNVPKKPFGLVSQTGLIDLDQATSRQHGELNQLMRDTNKFQKDYVEHIRELKVIDLTKKDPSRTPTFQVLEQMERDKRIFERMRDLKVRTAQLRAQQIPGALAPSDFANFPTPDFSKGNYQKVAEIKVPAVNPVDAGKQFEVLVSHDQFLKLHSKASLVAA